MKKAALNLLARGQMESSGNGQNEEISLKLKKLRQQFERIDLDGSGSINAAELAQAMNEVNMHVSDEEIQKIIAEIDYVGNGKINYTEFLAATLTITLTDTLLLRLFKKFDVDNTGYISKENLIDAFRRLGHTNISMDEVTEMIAKHDIAKDGQVSFDEFKVIFEEDGEHGKSTPFGKVNALTLAK